MTVMGVAIVIVSVAIMMFLLLDPVNEAASDAESQRGHAIGLGVAGAAIVAIMLIATGRRKG
jgi:hypothetical protein